MNNTQQNKDKHNDNANTHDLTHLASARFQLGIVLISLQCWDVVCSTCKAEGITTWTAKHRSQDCSMQQCSACGHIQPTKTFRKSHGSLSAVCKEYELVVCGVCGTEILITSCSFWQGIASSGNFLHFSQFLVVPCNSLQFLAPPLEFLATSCKLSQLLAMSCKV